MLLLFYQYSETAVSRICNDVKVYHNDFFLLILQSTDVIFDAILPEWALSVFCKKFDFTRCEALETLKLQSQALSNVSDSEL